MAKVIQKTETTMDYPLKIEVKKIVGWHYLVLEDSHDVIRIRLSENGSDASAIIKLLTIAERQRENSRQALLL